MYHTIVSQNFLKFTTGTVVTFVADNLLKHWIRLDKVSLGKSESGLVGGSLK